MERYDNLNGVFAIKNAQKFANKHLLIVDDVITTGATTITNRIIQNIPNVKISSLYWYTRSNLKQ